MYDVRALHRLDRPRATCRGARVPGRRAARSALFAALLVAVPAGSALRAANATPAPGRHAGGGTVTYHTLWNGRSGWCPGAAVNPVEIALPDLAPGRHRLRVTIPMGAPEGPSESAWNVSGVLLATVRAKP